VSRRKEAMEGGKEEGEKEGRERKRMEEGSDAISRASERNEGISRKPMGNLA
jgi:flagellar biosynthesis/type III secretory pathway protein FliH